MHAIRQINKFNISEELQAIQRSVRQFGENEVHPREKIIEEVDWMMRYLKRP